MRVEKLEDKEAAGLRAMGFTVDDEGEAATIKAEAGDLSISVMRPYKADQFYVEIELPNGSTLVCHAYRRALYEQA
jgi:hypothetical protein